MTEKYDELKKYFDALRDTTPPRDPHKRAQGRARFLRDTTSTQTTTVPSLFMRLVYATRAVKYQFGPRAFTAAVSVLIAAVIAFASIGGTVYAAQDSLPDQFLYTVKTWTEDVRLSLTKNPQERFDLLNTYSQRRITEIQALAGIGKTIPAAPLLRLEKHSNQMLREAQKLEGDSHPKTLSKMRQVLQRANQVLAIVHSNHPQQGEENVEPTRMIIQQHLKDVQGQLDNPGQNRRNEQSGPPTQVSPGRKTPPAPDPQGKQEGKSTPEGQGPENQGQRPTGTPDKNQDRPDNEGRGPNPDDQGNIPDRISDALQTLQESLKNRGKGKNNKP